MDITAPIFMDKALRIKRCKRNTYLYNINDTIVGTSLDKYGEYAEVDFALTDQILRAGDVVIDVGANIGTHSVEFSKLVGDTGLVISLEPSTLNYSFLVSNLTINSCFNTQHFKAAISDQDHGYIPVFNVNEQRDHSELRLGYDEYSGQETEYTATFTLDEISLERCAFIKISVPGRNYQVLKTAERLLTTIRPFVLIEYDMEEKEEILQYFASANYHCYIVPNKLYNSKNHFKYNKNIFRGVKRPGKLFAHRAEVKMTISGYKRAS
jgi:FkbM family methyltransferase